MIKAIYILFIVCATNATTLHIYGGEDTSEYLGCLNCISTNSNSIWNTAGTYGSTVNTKSIWNTVGTYGSTVSRYSPFNSIAMYPPSIYDENGNYYGLFTVNEIKTKRIDYDLTDFIATNIETIRKNLRNTYDLILSVDQSIYQSVNNMEIFAQDSKEQFLGIISTNQYTSNSIAYEYGSYGSQYSSTSIFNNYSNYGSSYSSYSAFNDLATNPPIIYKYATTGVYTAQYYLTTNTYKTPRIDPMMLKYMLVFLKVSFGQ